MTEPRDATKEFSSIGKRMPRVRTWHGYVRNIAKYADSRDLLAKLLIANLSFSYLTSNYSLTRNIYYFAILPLALLTVGKDDLRRVLASPIFQIAGMYFAVLTVASLLAPDARLNAIGKHFRDSLLVLSFLFLLAHLTWRNEAFLTNLLWFMSSAAGLMALANILIFYGGNSWVFTTGDRLTGITHLTPVTGLNELGGLYAIACVAAAAVAGRSQLPKFARASAVIASLVLFLAVILIQSRGALLSVSCGLFVALVFGSGRVSQRLVIGLCFAVLLGGFFLFSPLLTNYIARADSSRFLLWQEYVTEFVARRPLLGYGVSTDQIVDLQSYRHPHAHNVVLHAWVKGGIFAALALLATIGFSFVAALRAVRVLGLLPPLALMTTAFVATAIDYGIVASSLGYQWILFWLPIGLCLGSSLRLRERVRSSGAG